jgi:transposase
LGVVTKTVSYHCQQPAEPNTSVDNGSVHVSSIKREYPQRFGNSIFAIPGLGYINRAAYWDYQREKIYVRSSPRLKRIAKKNIQGRAKSLPVNEVVEFPPPSCCPRCGTTEILKHNMRNKLVYDLKFSRTGIKRRIVKCVFHRYSCSHCSIMFYPAERPLTGEKYGRAILAYMIHQIIDLQLPQSKVAQNLNLLFSFRLNRTIIQRQKSRAAVLYKDAYEAILSRILAGRLIHADETRIGHKIGEGYVWALTSLEEVTYFYSETREGEKFQELLSNFKGVLVSDFYAVYDGVECPQQKCLIHLIRDLNNALLKEPFNEELKQLVHEFEALLRPMIETVDRFGLKTFFLRKHKILVERFYKSISKCDYKSETASKSIKRFEKNRNKLFTFLDYDGVPWNNNNAEHAIKAFADLRSAIDGTSSAKGIQEYLTLLSISETCKYKGISFLDFLRSGSKDIDEFLVSGWKP